MMESERKDFSMRKPFKSLHSIQKIYHTNVSKVLKGSEKDVGNFDEWENIPKSKVVHI